ncbi:MAG: 50S ribosomal protein L24 [Deltaproteobacteria bacterium]
MLKIKKGDMVQVMKGKDAGKKGKVLFVYGVSNRALVEGINMHTKHRRQTRQDQQGGIVHIEAPIAIANLMVICKACNAPSRIAFKKSKDNVKTRICKKCNEVL